MLLSSAVWLWLGSIRLHASPAGLRVEHRILGISLRKFIARERIANVVVQKQGSVFWGIQVDPVPGKGPRLQAHWLYHGGGKLRDRRSADLLAGRIRAALARTPE